MLAELYSKTFVLRFCFMFFCFMYFMYAINDADLRFRLTIESGANLDTYQIGNHTRGVSECNKHRLPLSFGHSPHISLSFNVVSRTTFIILPANSAT